MKPLTELRQIAEKAESMPWEKSPTDVPHSLRWEFMHAITADDVMGLVRIAEAAELAMGVLKTARSRIVECGGSGWKLEAQRCSNAHEALRAALASMSTATDTGRNDG